MRNHTSQAPILLFGKLKGFLAIHIRPKGNASKHPRRFMMSVQGAAFWVSDRLFTRPNAISVKRQRNGLRSLLARCMPDFCFGPSGSMRRKHQSELTS